MTQTRFFWPSLGRAFANIWHPRMLLLSLLPFLICGSLALVAYYFSFWEFAIDAVRSGLDNSQLLKPAYSWLAWAGFTNANAFLAPLIVAALCVPIMIVISLLVVALLALPQALSFVAARRFASLERKGKAAIVQSALNSLGWTFIALVALMLSILLWFIPPLFLIVPPLIWGWLTYKVMSFDALADHATAEERRVVVHNHRTPLLAMGIASGLIGAAPSLLWVSSIATVVLFPIISFISIWLYTIGFLFTALWFVHYCLAALEDERGQRKSLDAFPAA